jgi:uncharacterized membrane protein YgcG
MARVRGFVNAEKNRLRNDSKILSNKKDIMLEEQTIGAFTLIFQDPNTEARWQSTNLIRQIRLTQRLLFISALFQGLFYWSDVVQREKEGGTDEHFVLFLSLRLLIGLVFVFGSFLIGTGLVLPNQVLLFWAQIFYGGPSIAIYCWTRTKSSQWDFLFLVYGLCFFTLPKMSPLNFIYAFSGAGMFSFLFIYISAFNLSLSEWILSSTYLLVIVVLFMYISYSSERSSRERWLLRQRLHREHIDLKIVVSSIEEDMSKAIEDRAPRRQYYRSSSSGQHWESDGGDRAHASFEAGGQRVGPGGASEKTVVLFFKGLAAWGLVMVMGYMFDSFATDAEGEMSNSAPFVLLLHSTGFSIFLMYFTGQVRWFVLNGITGLCMIWVLHKSGMDNRWIVFSTHSVGYIILATVVVIMILLFGGVVLVWTHLIDFVKEILTRYPQVKDDLNQERVLEQVLIRYLSDLPSISLAHTKPLDEESAPEGKHASGTLEETHRISNTQSEYSDNGPAMTTCPSKPLVKVIAHPNRLNTCYFCFKEHPNYLLQVCDGWLADNKSSSSEISMCTPYTQLTIKNQELTSELDDMRVKIRELEDMQERMVVERDRIMNTAATLKETVSDLEVALAESRRAKIDSVAREREARSADVEKIITQHNRQLSELKRLHKISLAAERRRWEGLVSTATSREEEGEASTTAPLNEPTHQSKSTLSTAAESKRSQANRKRTGDETTASRQSSPAIAVIAATRGIEVKKTPHASPTPTIRKPKDPSGPDPMPDAETALAPRDPKSVEAPENIGVHAQHFDSMTPSFAATDLLLPTPEDDDFNRFFMSSMNEIEGFRLSLGLSSTTEEEEAIISSGGATSRMKYARELGTTN